MQLPARDAELVQIMNVALADAGRRAGSWLACQPGCTQCCHGAFAINALDAERLRAGVAALRTTDPAAAEAVQQRARAWIAEYAADFPGDSTTGILGTSQSDQESFEDFANDAPCPALNPASGLCDVYAHRPMTCRVFGPPVRTQTEGGEALGCCELCFVGADEQQIADCEMPVPHALEAEVLAVLGDTLGHAAERETVVAYTLLRN